MNNRKRIRKRLHELKDEDTPEDVWADYMEEVTSALGWFIVAFNDLDFEVTATICDLSAKGTKYNTDITFALLSSKPFSQKVKDLGMIFNLATVGKPNEAELQSRAKDILTRIDSLNSERNALVHANYHITEQEENDTIIATKIGIDKLGFYHEYFKCSPEHIEELEDQCEKLTDDIMNFTEELMKK